METFSQINIEKYQQTTKICHKYHDIYLNRGARQKSKSASNLYIKCISQLFSIAFNA
jgi:hypothetical protein